MAVREFLVTKVIRLFHLPAGNWQAGRLLKNIRTIAAAFSALKRQFGMHRKRAELKKEGEKR